MSSISTGTLGTATNSRIPGFLDVGWSSWGTGFGSGSGSGLQKWEDLEEEGEEKGGAPEKLGGKEEERDGRQKISKETIIPKKKSSHSSPRKTCVCKAEEICSLRKPFPLKKPGWGCLLVRRGHLGCKPLCNFFKCTKIIWALGNWLGPRVKCGGELLPTESPSSEFWLVSAGPAQVVSWTWDQPQPLKPASNYMLSATFKKAIFLYISRT